MKVIDIEDVRFPESIQSAYMTCKYLERKGIGLDAVTLGNVHDIIEEVVDDNQLPITQVIETRYPASNEPADTIEGYLIRA